MAHHLQQTYTPQSVDETALELGKRGYQKHHQIHGEPVIQTDQMYKHPIVQNQTYSENVNPRHATAQIYRAEDIQQHSTYQEVKQVEQPPLKHTTQAHVCDICNKTLKSKKGLAAHYVSHNVKKDHICDVCSKGFTRKAYLQKHYLSHSGKKSHVYDVCSRGFVKKSSLTEHSLTHTELTQKPHVCDICQRIFTRKENLKRHKLTHNGKKKHICEICNSKFSLKQHLIRHYQLHSADREGEQKKEKINAQDAKEQKGQIIIAEAEIEHQEVDLEQQVTHVQIEPVHREVSFAENSGSHEHALMFTEQIENVHDFVIMDQSLPHFHQTFNIGAQGRQALMTDQEGINQVEYQQIGQETLVQIGHKTFTVIGQQPYTSIGQPPMTHIVHSTMAAIVNDHNVPPQALPFDHHQI